MRKETSSLALGTDGFFSSGSGGFVVAARMLDKARADLLGINGEYNFYPCGLGAFFWKFTGLDAMKFKEFVGTGATDAAQALRLLDPALQVHGH